MLDIGIHPNYKFLSHSSDDLLSACQRKYQIYKLRPSFGSLEMDEGQIDLDFGTIVGIGVQSFLESRDCEKAYWDMFLAWTRVLDDEEGIKKKKTFWFAMIAIDKFRVFCEQELSRYELVSFNGKPATELGFSIDCGNGFYYRGYLDALLFDTHTPALVPLECKTTGTRNLDEAMYKNSGQGSGYKLIVDAVSKLVAVPLLNKYKVIYPVYQTYSMEWEQFPFTKTNVDLARWIKVLHTRKHMIEFNGSENFWPMNGSACYNWGKQCKYFGVCNWEDELLFGPSAEKIELKSAEKDRINYQFHFKLEELVQMVLEG